MGENYCNSTLSYSSMRFWIFDDYSLLSLTMFESAKIGLPFPNSDDNAHDYHVGGRMTD